MGFTLRVPGFLRKWILKKGKFLKLEELKIQNNGNLEHNVSMSVVS